MASKLKLWMGRRGPVARQLRMRGDAARDAHAWGAAAEAYRAYLARVPGDFAAWVQLGNTAKEGGRYAEADRAYARALALRPDDADLFLQYGRLRKLEGRMEEASRFFERSHKLEANVHALNERKDVIDRRSGTRAGGDKVDGWLRERCEGVELVGHANVAVERGLLRLDNDDPWIVFDVGDEIARAPAALLRFTVRRRDKSDLPEKALIYLDYGSGFDETHVIVPKVRADGYAVFLVRPGSLRGLRWDPSTESGLLEVELVALTAVTNAADFDAAIAVVVGGADEGATAYDAMVAPALLRAPVLSDRTLASGEVQRLQRLSPSGFDAAHDYTRWVALFASPGEADYAAMATLADRMAIKPFFSFVMPVYNPPPDLLCQCIDAMLAQNWDRFEICIADDASSDPSVRKILADYAAQESRIKFVQRKHNGHISAASNTALALATGDYIVLVDHDDLVPDFALFVVAQYVNYHPDAKILFSDEDKIDIHGSRFDPYFKSEYNAFLMYGHNMVSHLGIYDRQLMQSVGGFRCGLEGSQDYDLFLRCSERVAPSQIVHIPHVLYHWRAIPGSTALSAGQKSYAIRAAEHAINGHFERTGRPLRSGPGFDVGVSGIWPVAELATPISIIIPTKDGVDLLEACVRTILDNPHADAEIIVVDNGSIEPRTGHYLKTMEQAGLIRTLSYPGPFNFSAINNAAARIATGDILCFLNNDTEVLAPAWLNRARMLMNVPEIGIVGARLLYPDGSLQHFGVGIGMGDDRIAAHFNLFSGRDKPGYFGKARLASEFSAVTAACMFVRRSVFEQVGGFDEELAVAFNDVDFCLRVRQAGWLIVGDPQIELIHKESKTRGDDAGGEKRARLVRDAAAMRDRWGPVLDADPYYTPNCPLLRPDYGLAYPPRVARPWHLAGEPV